MFRTEALILVLFILAISIASVKGPDTLGYSPVDIGYDKPTANENFDLMMDVLTHQRCMNCHPSDNIPKQGDNRRPHYFGMARGNDNMGFEATRCTTCHQSVNNTYSGVPGAPHWSLAPASMGWQGLTRIEIAKSLLDKNMNGGKTYQELVKHMTEDELVLWAWDPGVDANGNKRTPPPISHEKFSKAIRNWFENGAVIPLK